MCVCELEEEPTKCLSLVPPPVLDSSNDDILRVVLYIMLIPSSSRDLKPLSSFPVLVSKLQCLP